MNIDPETTDERKLLHSLRAEDEPWLSEVYVFPTDFEQYASQQSMIFFAPKGGGRTALRLMISKQQENKPVLVVTWQPEAPDQELQGNPLASYAMRQMINAWCQALLLHLGEHHKRLETADSLTLQALTFLIQKFMTINPQFYLRSIAANIPSEGFLALENMLTLPPIELLKPEADMLTSTQALVWLLKSLGFDATWVFIDGLEKWPIGLDERSHHMLRAMLDTLAYLDIRGMFVKAFVPSEYAALYTRLGGVDRFRLLPQELCWDQEELAKMVLNRTTRLSEQPVLSFQDICTDEEWQDWLNKYAGHNPRAWLSLCKPFIENCLQGEKPLSSQEWKTISREHPPRLQMDGDRQRVLVGEYEASVTPQDLSILHYLYNRPRVVISREEIYYCAIHKLDEIPAPKTKPFEDPSTWTGLFDTALWRLRQAIEWEPSRPIYLLTIRGKGITLNNSL